ncbi:hypothetical protein A3Q56_01405 [Intoshia linei]|uniref:Uncharacterized protein n=1 Tax=Intoshia linei TaxID=1819745 RepID=A0A177B998_9BILA|nr:hypothetical protein A3Q56_01405 [Intoshia linei]
MKILLENIEYTVRCGKSFCETFITNTELPPGDSFSAVFFILYLAKTLGYIYHLKDHTYALPSHLHPQMKPKELIYHDYCTSPTKIHKMLKESINIDTQYAEDCGYAVVTQNTNAIHYIKIITLQILKSRHLLCNEEKTELMLAGKTRMVPGKSVNTLDPS